MTPGLAFAEINRTLYKLVADVPSLKWLVALLVSMADYVFPARGARDVAIATAMMILLDTATGVVAAWVKKKPISSREFARVLVKFVGYGSVTVVASVATKHVPGLTDFQSATVSGVLTLILVTELVSILENAAKMGIKLPFGLYERLKERLSIDKPDDEQ
jgi:phage-related holin